VAPPSGCRLGGAGGLPGSLSARTAPAHPTGSPGDTEPGVQVRVTQPEIGTRLLRDPETPADLATIGLEVVVDPPTSEVVWYVDGAPYQVAGYPYSVRWSIRPGEHVIEARLAHTRVGSNRVMTWVFGLGSGGRAMKPSARAHPRL
jgi:hypothetical protein